ncbi:hypothetical protein [Bacillus cereus]|uniref:hypothetical protein n=1 Tax=Bacillus cereus TaxID=1396 RepID=UPI000BFE3A18|nr:hypothetical protein [Bacillus cereus]PGY73719.1 hypothetical protein COE34_03170 [Bacillus cereus]
MGGLLPSFTNAKYIEKIIGTLKETFHPSIRKELYIEDVEYVISTDTIRKIKGYEEETFKASGLPNEDESQIEKIVFFTEGISRDINKRFFKINHLTMFKEVVEMYAMFVFIHELVHIQQFKNGMTMEEYNETEYEINRFEKEANDKAEEYLSRLGEFQGQVAKLINSDQIVDYGIFTKLKNLYNE